MLFVRNVMELALVVAYLNILVIHMWNVAQNVYKIQTVIDERLV